MIRRLLLIGILVVVAIGIVGGIGLYLRRDSNPKLLSRIDLALRANQIERAQQLAARYVGKNPGDWKGYYMQGRAYMQAGRYEEARQPLQEAVKRDPSQPSAVLALSESYSFPASKRLGDKEDAKDPAALQQIIVGLGQANKILQDAKPSEGKPHLEARQALGLNEAAIGDAYRKLSARLDKDVQTAESVNAGQAAHAKREEATKAVEAAQQAEDSAVQTLLELVKQDATFARADECLIRLCTQRNDADSLQTARDCIMALKDKDRPAIPTMLLAMRDVETAAESGNPEQLQRSIPAAQAILDNLLRDHPDDLRVTLSRAKLALAQGDWKMADTLCGQILQKDARQALARLYRCQALMGKGQYADAERELFSLKADFPDWTEAHYAYAQVAAYNGKSELANESLRKVTRLDPRAAGAHRMLAESLLRQGFYDEAFEDARSFYELQPGAPAAIALFAESARLTGHSDMAYKAFQVNRPKFQGRPETLAAMADAYARMGDVQQSRDVAAEVVKIAPTSEASSLAVAMAMSLLSRASEAQALLADCLARHPDSAVLHYELSRLYSRSGKLMQALEQLRSAVSLTPRNTTYRLDLAKTMFGMGMLDEAQDECKQVLSSEPSNPAAILLDGQLRVSRGESLKPEEMMAKPGKSGLVGMPLATIYLSMEQPDKCLEICQQELKKTPNDANVMYLAGQAYLMMGQSEKCLEQWKEAVRCAPGQLAAYSGIANLLSRTSTPEQVRQVLSAIPSVDPALTDQVIAGIYQRTGDFDKAAETYGSLAGQSRLSDDQRNMAVLMQSRAYARAGKFDAALQTLDRFNSAPGWHQEALFQKARVLIDSKREPEAKALLTELRTASVQSKDSRQILAVAMFYFLLGDNQTCLEMCEQLEAASAKDAQPYLLHAAILLRQKKEAEAVACYEKAIANQPENLVIYRMLSQTLSALGEPIKAMEVLKRMDGLGQTGRSAGLFEQASLYSQYGLAEQAGDCLGVLATQEGSSSSKLKLALGNALIQVGRTEQARAILKDIPVHSAVHVAAQRSLAQLAATPEEKLQILRQLRQDRLADLEIFTDELTVLVESHRAEEAAALFKAYLQKLPASQSVPQVAGYVALKAMLVQGHIHEAKDMSLRLAKETSAPRWHDIGLLLCAEDDPQAAKAMLPAPASCSLNEALIGLILDTAKETQDSWYQQIRQIDKQGSQATPPRRVPAAYRLLAALAAGKSDDAQAELGALDEAGGVGKQVAADMLSSSQADSQAPLLARELLKASLAGEMDPPLAGSASLGCTWAMRTLQAHPRCQWAAAIAIQSRAEKADFLKLQELLQPADCPLAQVIRASILINDRQFDKAEEIYKQLTAADPKNLQLLFTRASVLESAGRLSEALDLYEKVLAAGFAPSAANNVACLLVELHADDPAKLQEAYALAKQAVDSSPDSAAVVDTLGWITLRQGHSEQACKQLRLAIKGLTSSPEAHCHLALAESACGNADWARWHFAAAVSLAKGVQAQGQELTPVARKAVEQAQAELAKTQPK